MMRKVLLAGAFATASLVGTASTPASAETTAVLAVCTVDTRLAGGVVFVPVGVPVTSETTVAGQCGVGVAPVK